MPERDTSRPPIGVEVSRPSVPLTPLTALDNKRDTLAGHFVFLGVELSRLSVPVCKQPVC